MELKDFRLASLSTIKAAAALPDHDNNPKQHNRAPDGVDARELTRRLESKLDAFLRCALESEEWKSIENPEAHPSYVRSVMKYVLLEVFSYGPHVAEAPKKQFRFKNRLLSLDSTIIELCASMFDWAHWRHTKGGGETPPAVGS
jgi:hypothetical protein